MGDVERKVLMIKMYKFYIKEENNRIVDEA